MPHIHEKIDFTASAYIIFNNRVLLRFHPKLNNWLGVGGHIELDEDPNEAVLREVKEEVGLDITLISSKDIRKYEVPRFKELIPPEYLNIHYFNDTHRHCDLVYFAISNTDEVVPEYPDENCKWFSEAELKEKEYNLLPDIIFYCQQALKLASGKK
jgi:8-oxo-dGTP diphosphatase